MFEKVQYVLKSNNSDRTGLIRFDADSKGIISMTAKWKVKDLPFEWNE